jgi:phospholipase C
MFAKPRPVTSVPQGEKFQGSGEVSGVKGRTICLLLREVTAGGSVVQNVKGCVTATGAWQAIGPVNLTMKNAGDQVGYLVQQTAAATGDSLLADSLSLIDVTASPSPSPTPTTTSPSPSPTPSPSTSTTPITPIQHIVVLMQENHTFDNELGYWCNANPGRCTGMPAAVTLSDGTTLAPGTTADIVPDEGHGISSQTAAIDGGKMDGWQKVSGCGATTGYSCVSGYQPAAVPNLTALANTYAIEDRAFTMADAPSWGGHLDELAATTDGFSGNNPYQLSTATSAGPGWGCDATNKVAEMLPVNGQSVPPQPSCVPDFSLGLPNGGAWESTQAQHVPTIMDEMDAAGISWKIYAQPSALGTKQGGYIWSSCPSFADCLYTSQDTRLVDSNQYFTDAQNGTLPSVSFIMPAGDGNQAYSQHNSQSNAAGDNWIGKIASAALNGPEAASTVLIVTYDDCGCFYDSVPPPLAPDGRQMGPRVPFIVAGAFVKPGFTDSTPTSNTGSILAFTEWVFGLPALGVNDARAYNLSGMFNFTQTPLQLPRMTWQRLPAWKYKVTKITESDGT